MSKQKKNVFAEFIQDEYTPSKNQDIVKYLQGRGNNLHSVEDFRGNEFLVSMPKKYRQTVWLKKGDCLAIDPVLEGNKVKGEIFCILPVVSVIQLITTDKWPQTPSGDSEDLDGDYEVKNRLLEFFKKDLKQSKETTSSGMLPSSSEDETDTDSE